MTSVAPIPYPFHKGLIIHINSFTHQIAGGYLIENRKKVGSALTAKQVAKVLELHNDIKVSCIMV